MSRFPRLRLPGWPLRLFSRRRSTAPLAPRYSLQTESESILQIAVQGDHTRVTQLVLDVGRMLPNPVGLVLVEYREVPAEWVSSSLNREQILRAVVMLRDLLGRSAIDLALFSSREGMELVLDRFGRVEIRAGAWNEPRLRSVLERLGFAEQEHVALYADLPKGEFVWTVEARQRLYDVREQFKLAAPPRAEAKDIG